MRQTITLLFLPFLLFSQIQSNEAAFIINGNSVGISNGGSNYSSVYIPDFSPPGSAPEIILATLKSWPGAVGAGNDIRIDPSTATFYEVTNTNDSGAGSFRTAFEANGPKIIIIKVEGRVDATSVYQNTTANKGDMAVWGQFAPGLGLTIDHDRMSIDRAGDYYYRFMTLQASQAIGCTVNVNCYDALNYYRIEPDHSVALDHCSLRYSPDQIFTINVDEGEANINLIKSSVTYNLFAEADPAHSTGSIMNLWTSANNPTVDIGEHTFARNMFYDTSHRFQNLNTNGDFENYNNYVVNHKNRASRYNKTPNVDLHRNYYAGGNVTGASLPYNYLNQGNTDWGGGGGNPPAGNEPSIFAAFNHIDGINTNTADNQQDDLYLWWDTESETYYTTAVTADGPVAPEFFTTTQQFSFNPPADGYWDATDVPLKARASVGHNRGINADGTPFYGYDDVDTDYFDKAANNTTNSTYRATGAWNNSTFPGTALYTDTDGDYMPDWFEDQFAFLDKNSAADQLTTSNVTWDFSAISATHNYIVTNNAGYTNLEMCAAFYAGDFETILDGTNNLSID